MQIPYYSVLLTALYAHFCRLTLEGVLTGHDCSEKRRTLPSTAALTEGHLWHHVPTRKPRRRYFGLHAMLHGQARRSPPRAMRLCRGPWHAPV